MDAKDYDHKKLKEIRERKFTQEELAKRLNKHVKTISRAETGNSASYKLLKAITAECGVPITTVLRENCLPATA
jgi:transcriptional regulator with XRE-family HTH domain